MFYDTVWLLDFDSRKEVEIGARCVCHRHDDVERVATSTSTISHVACRRCGSRQEGTHSRGKFSPFDFLRLLMLAYNMYVQTCFFQLINVVYIQSWWWWWFIVYVNVHRFSFAPFNTPFRSTEQTNDWNLLFSTLPMNCIYWSNLYFSSLEMTDFIRFSLQFRNQIQDKKFWMFIYVPTGFIFLPDFTWYLKSIHYDPLYGMYPQNCYIIFYCFNQRIFKVRYFTIDSTPKISAFWIRQKVVLFWTVECWCLKNVFFFVADLAPSRWEEDRCGPRTNISEFSKRDDLLHDGGDEQPRDEGGWWSVEILAGSAPEGLQYPW